MLVIVGGLAGVLVFGLALPFATGLGWIARESATGFRELPTDVELGALPERSRVVEADGSTLATFYSENRTYVPLHEVAQAMQDATIAIEDHRFYDHGPIDLKGTVRAFIGNVEAGEITAGGSTLTQQYAKLLRRSQAESEAEAAAALEESYSRKLSELRLAIEIEREFSKDEILERYINIAYYGASVYGVEEAAKRYFSTSAENLTLPQAAMLAGLVQRPSGYDPTQNPEAALERRNVVIDRMAELEMITADEAAAAKQSELGLDVSPARNGCSATWAPFYCQYVQNELDVILGEDAEDLLYQGGLTIETTLERKPQVAAQEAIADWVAPTDDSAAALASVEPGTGAIKAITHSREWGDGEGQTHFNYAVDRTYVVDGVEYSMGGGDGFQPGSTFKVFVAAAALQQGISVNTPINSPPSLHMGGDTWQACDGPIRAEPPDWTPSNYAGSPAGTMNLRKAIEKSVNTYFLQLSQETGLCDPWNLAHQSGVRQSGTGEPIEEVASFTLGVNYVSPLSMAEAYAMFAARGVHCEPYAITRVIGRDGEVLFEREPNCNRVLDEGVADAVNDLLQGVVDHPGATGNAMRLSGGRPAAGKTGTTNDVKAVWWVGYTPQLSTAVGLSDPDPPEGDWTLEGRTFNGEQFDHLCGGCIPGPIWKQMMNAALADEQVLSFVPADRSVLQGQTSRVPDVRGMELQEASQALTRAGFRVTVEQERVKSEVPANQVVEVDPSPWSWVSVGSEVSLTISKGDKEQECRPIPIIRDCEDENGGGGGDGGGGPGTGDGGGGGSPGTGDGSGGESNEESTDGGGSLGDLIFPDE